MSLTPERINELKQIIHEQLSERDIQSKIKSIVSELPRDGENSNNQGPVGHEEIMQQLQRRGIVADILQQINFNFEGKTPEVKPTTHLKICEGLQQKQAHTANIDPTKRYLYFQVLGGKAFLDYLQQKDFTSTAFFTLFVLFRNQRFKSRPVPCACDPNFAEGFLLEIHKHSAEDASMMADNTAMLSIADPIHLVLIKTNSTGENTLVSSKLYDWRLILTAPSGHLTTSIECMGTGPEYQVPVGLLEIHLELFPRSQKVLSAEIVEKQLTFERNSQKEKERLFLVYAREWWNEYVQIQTEHEDRLVKIYAQDENAESRPVCAYVKPLRAGRLLDSPRQAARFVSLMSYGKTESVGSNSTAEQWTTMHAFLCRNKGDCMDHAVLLCSLLLGFGLNAHICVGTRSKGVAHMWVMTTSIDGTVVFWESLSGRRYIHRPIDPDDLPIEKQVKRRYPFKTAGCVFSHKSFYANCQPSDCVELCRFDLQNRSQWKAMSPDAILSVSQPRSCPLWPPFPSLCPSSLDASLVSNDLEHKLRILVTEHRCDQGLSTLWDDNLSYLLTPALSAYEIERTTGITPGNEEFQDAVQQAVLDGHTFKGFPIQFSHRNARRAFTTCLNSPVCEEIINSRGDRVCLAVRVRVYSYPESVCATWVMFACKYQCIL